MLRFLVDECCRQSLILELQSLGYNVVPVIKVSPSVGDVEVLALARRLERIVITDDKDFGDLVVRKGETALGVVLLRTSTDDGAVQAALIDSVIKQTPGHIAGYFTVVEDKKVRHRRISD